MARIFLSYSHVDLLFVEALAKKLRRIHGYDHVWFDEELYGGSDWWKKILTEIAARDIFIYVLSNDSVQSEYCQAEFEEARRLQKQIIPVQARERTHLTDKLKDIHYINLAKGVADADALTDLYHSINMCMLNVSQLAPEPLWQPATAKPGKVYEKPRPPDTPDVDTSMLNVPQAERENAPANTRVIWRQTKFYFSLLVVLGILVGAVLLRTNLPGPVAIGTDILELTPPNISTDVAASAATETEVSSVTHTTSPTATETATDLPADTQTNTATLEVTLDFVLLARATLDTEATRIATLSTSTPTTTDTATSTPTWTAGHTNTSVPTHTVSPSATSTVTPSYTNALTVTRTASSTHTQSPTVTNTFTLTVESPRQTARLRVIRNSVNLRVGPGTDYRIARSARRDDEFNIQAQYSRQGWVWYLVAPESDANVDRLENVAWIRSDLVEILDYFEVTQLPTASSISATPRPVTLVPTQSVAITSVQDVTQAPDPGQQPTQPPIPTVNRGTPEG